MTFIKFVEKRLSHKVLDGERRKSIIYLGDNRPTGTFVLNFARKGVPSRHHIYEWYKQWIIKYYEGGV